MKTPSKRARRVADLIQQEVGTLIHKGVKDPRLSQLTIISVDVSSDLRNAKMYFTLMNDASPADALKALEKATGFIRHHLAKNTDLRYVPKLTFLHDDTFESAQRISTILNDVLPAENEHFEGGNDDDE